MLIRGWGMVCVNPTWGGWGGAKVRINRVRNVRRVQAVTITASLVLSRRVQCVNGQGVCKTLFFLLNGEGWQGV